MIVKLQDATVVTQHGSDRTLPCYVKSKGIGLLLPLCQSWLDNLVFEIVLRIIAVILSINHLTVFG
jgi:hypothetical protein